MSAGAGRGTWVAGGLAAVLALTVLVYVPGLAGPFVFDDLPAIVDAPRLRMTSLDGDSVTRALYSAHASLPHRGLAHLSFALNHYLGGAFVPVQVKGTNLAIHLAAGLVLFALSRRLAHRLAPPGASATGSDLLALLVTAVWLLHPLQLTSVLYAVQRMTSLAGLCVLAGVLGYVLGRERLARGQRGGGALMAGSVVGGVLAGVLVKENAVLLAPLALLVELVFFSRTGLTRGARALLAGLHGVLVLLPVVGVGLLLLWRFDLVEATYASRDFTPAERILTQSRVLFHYLQMFFQPRLSAFGLFHDDVQVSRSLFSPATTAPAVAAWLALIGAAIVGVLRRRGWAFGIAWFLTAHAMESTLIGLEMVHEHRNYVPLAGLTLGLAISARQLLVRVRLPGRLVAAAGIGVLAVLAVLTYGRADIWRTEQGLVEFSAEVHPRSYRAASQRALLRVVAGQPLSEVYALWMHAAKLTHADQTALLEVIKLVSFALHEQAGDPAPADCAPPGTLPDRMPEQRRCLEQLLDSLRAEMSRHARTSPISPTTVVALEHLGNCSMAGTAYCAALHDDLTRWLDAALAGGRMRPRLRPKVALLLARLKTRSGDTREGLRLAEQAARDSGYGPTYTHALVSLHLELGMPEQARDAVARLVSPDHWRPGNDGVARELLRAIDAHARAAAAAP